MKISRSQRGLMWNSVLWNRTLTTPLSSEAPGYSLSRSNRNQNQTDLISLWAKYLVQSGSLSRVALHGSFDISQFIHKEPKLRVTKRLLTKKIVFAYIIWIHFNRKCGSFCCWPFCYPPVSDKMDWTGGFAHISKYKAKFRNLILNKLSIHMYDLLL